MARPTLAQLREGLGSAFAGWKQTAASDSDLLAIMTSGTNPDGTPFVLPVRIEDGVAAAVMGVQKINAGFMAVGQTAKSFIGKSALGSGTPLTVALETVTGAVNAQVQVSGTGTTGGEFHVAFTVNGVSYVSEAIPYNSSAAAVAQAFQNSNPAPPASSFKGTGGALPGTPVAVEFEGSLGGLPVTGLSIISESQVPITGTLPKISSTVTGTPGKTLYLTDIFASTDAKAEVTTTLDFRLQAAGVDIFRSALHALQPIELPGIETQPFATTGQAVQISIASTGTAQNVWFSIYGYEQ